MPSLKHTTLATFGILLLVHSGFSVFELKQFSKRSSAVSFEIPVDIYLELCVSTIMLVYTVFSSVLYNNEKGISLLTGTKVPLDKLKLKDIYMNQAVLQEEKLDSGVFDELENNVMFMDVNKRRQEFTEWLDKN